MLTTFFQRGIGKKVSGMKSGVDFSGPCALADRPTDLKPGGKKLEPVAGGDGTMGASGDNNKLGKLL